MSLLDAGKLVLITVTPTLIGATIIYAPKWCAAAAREWTARRPQQPMPAGPPIEQLAADLRRLLRLHEDLTRTAQLATLAHRVWAVEAAIGVRAIEAAKALDVPHRTIEPLQMLGRTELRRLLHALAAAGLVLPAEIGQFTKDGRL